MAAQVHVETTPRRGRGPDGAAALLVGTAVVLTTVAPMAVLSPHGPAGAAAATPAPLPRWETGAALPATPAAAVVKPAPPSSPEAGQARVWRERHTIVIASRQAPRAEVARQLAALTGVDPQRPAAVLHGARPLTLHWRGSDAAEAWRRVLGAQAGHALQCDGARCRLWLIAQPAAAAALVDPDGSVDAPPAADLDPVTDRLPAEAGHDGAADAGADDGPPPTWEPTQPDPPGLFPAR